MADNNRSGHVDDYIFNTKAGIAEWLDAVIEDDDDLQQHPSESPIEDFIYEFDSSSDAEATQAEHKKSSSDPDETESAPNSQDAGNSPAEDEEESRNVTHQPDSLGGMVRLQRIRQYFMMPNSHTFEQIRKFLEDNTTVLRHLATYTIPHPDHYITADEEETVFEPVRERSRADTAIGILFDVNSIVWRSVAIEEQLEIITDNDENWNEIWFKDLMRKHRHHKLTNRAVAWLRRNHPRWRAMDDEAKEKRQRQLSERGASRLSNEVRFDDSAGKRRRGDDAEVSEASKRSRG